MSGKAQPRKNPANPDRAPGHRPGYAGSDNRPQKGYGGAGGGPSGRSPGGKAGKHGPKGIKPF